MKTRFPIIKISIVKNAAALSLLITMLALAQTKRIIITAEVDAIPANSNVFITGNTDELGTWYFMQQMEKKSERKWQLITQASVGDTIQFKFTRGNWGSEGVDSNGIEFPNFVCVVTKDTSLYFRIPYWRDLVQQKIIITPQRLANKSGFLELIEGWKYHIGDDSTWAKTDFNDADWKTINPMLLNEDLSKLNWTGNIWFRNHVYVDSSLLNKPFGLIFINTGAAEIYLNGMQLYRFGKVGNTKDSEIIFTDRDPKVIQFSGGNEQIIAVRYSNHQAEEMLKYGMRAGFTAELGDLNAFIPGRLEGVRSISIHQMAFGGFVLAFALMHLLLFIFYPKAIHNLYYSICMLAFAGVIYFGSQGYFTYSTITAMAYIKLNSVAMQLSLIFGLLTSYTSAYEKIPKQWALFLAVSTLFIIQTIFFPYFGSEYFNYAFFVYVIIVAIEIIRMTVKSRKNESGAGVNWLISLGFLFAMMFIVYQILIIAGVVAQPLFGVRLVYVYGIIFLVITVSITLSKKFSDTTKSLALKLEQVEELSKKTIEQERKAKEEELAMILLETDNARKTKELEEAKRFQLSMLPSKIPSPENLDIAVYMKPATEVGGDYYDFKHDSNGKLIIAVGDAAGHGMKAGTMVAAIKGLFTAEGINTDIVSFLDKSNLVIKNMQLGSLFMAMIIAKIENNKLSISSAGMPPALIFRSKDKIVEEIRMQALPLGGSANFRYFKRETNLSSGDTLLLMSDGFPELFNAQKEIFDYKRATEKFSLYANLPSEEIIENLCKEADNWRGNAPQEDDITFVVIKVR